MLDISMCLNKKCPLRFSLCRPVRRDEVKFVGGVE